MDVIREETHTSALDSAHAGQKELAFVAHELRGTHLVMKCLIDYLREEYGNIPAGIDSYLQKIEGQISKANQITEDLIQTSQSGLQLSTQKTDLHQILVGITNLCRDVVPQSRNLRFELQSPDSVIGLWDPRRIEEAMTNIFCNAIKYAKAEGGLIRAQVIELESKHEVLIKISDNGIGIPSESIPRIFEARYRAPNAQLAWVDGHGIGLTLTQEVVTRHGGKIWVESELNQGTTFFISLPQSK